MDTLAHLSMVLNPVLLALLGYMLKRWIERLEDLLAEFRKSQTECQLSLARTYRTKAEAEADSNRQWAKIDNHGERITRVETLLTGDGRQA
jgi:predicted  nucleic acid-binding Zn-ribbon protein